MSETVSNHLSIKTTRFFMKIIGMWYTNTRQERFLANFLLTCVILNLIIAIVVSLMELWNCWGDLTAISYNAPCTTSTLQEIMKLSVFLYYRRKVMDFNKFTENTYWKVKYDKPDLDILENCNRTCLWAYGASFLLMQTITWYYMSIPIIENLVRNETNRELPFRLWFNLPLTETPWFETAFALEAAATCCIGICSTTFAVFLFTINLYAAGQFQILQRRLEMSSKMAPNAAKNKSESFLATTESFARENLGKCIKRHQSLIKYIERVEHLYCYIMLGQALGGVLQICFSSFQIVLGAQVSLQRTGLSVVFFVGSVIQLFLFSWSCQTIIEQSLAVAEAAYRTSWHSLNFTNDGKIVRNAILIVICRARKPCILTVGKFAPMSLETFASVISTSISYFTVLRQMQEDLP